MKSSTVRRCGIVSRILLAAICQPSRAWQRLALAAGSLQAGNAGLNFVDPVRPGGNLGAARELARPPNVASPRLSLPQAAPADGAFTLGKRFFRPKRRRSHSKKKSPPA